MSISSALSAGVSGLNANAQRLATISDNIANSATHGYKRSITDFHSMVIQSSAGGAYTAGGVRTSSTRLVDERGQLQGTGNATDISINGRGFLPVTTLSSAKNDIAYDVSLATTGSFRPNEEGILVDSAGKVLLGWPADIDGTFPSFPRDSLDGLQPINVYHNQFAAGRTTEMQLGLNLPASVSDPANPNTPQDITLEYFGNLGQTETLNFAFTPTGTANEWDMVITDSNSAAVIGDYRLEFSDAAMGGGTLLSLVENDPAYAGTYDSTTGALDLDVGGGPLTVNVGAYGSPNGITQLDSNFAPTNLAKNGSAVGSLVSVEISPDGVLSGIYDSGFTRPIYRVPVIDVPNPNGLIAGDAQSYRISPDSGPIFLWNAGTGPTGTTAGFTREASTTDVARELTDLIQTQRAYSSNAKVIQTVDEMLQETTNLKR